jgi:hypothetical protein
MLIPVYTSAPLRKCFALSISEQRMASPISILFSSPIPHQNQPIFPIPQATE